MSTDVAASIQVGATVTGMLSVLSALGMILLPLIADGPKHSTQYALVFFLALFNLVEAITFAIGRRLLGTSGPCVAQASIMQFASACSFLWILYFCIALVRSIASGSFNKMAEPASMRTLAPPLVATVVVALLSCAILSVVEVYGDSSLWCWVIDADWALYMYYIPLMVIWLLSILSLAYAARAVSVRVSLFKRELKNRAASANRASLKHGQPSQQSESESGRRSVQKIAESERLRNEAQLQLMGYVFVFIVFSTFGLANRVNDAVNDTSPEWILVLQAWTMPLQGFGNALVFGGWVRRNWKLKCWCAEGAAPSTVSMTRPTIGARAPSKEIVMAAEFGDIEMVVESDGVPGSCARVAGDAGWTAAPNATAHIFASTWNVGEAEPSPADRARFAEWLPTGRDVYLIGLQECLDPASYVRLIEDILASHAEHARDPSSSSSVRGSGGYVLVTKRMIGSTNTALGYHGYIVLLAFVSRQLHDSAEWYEVQSGQAKLARGKSIGVARAANKGAVAAAFRFHSTTVAVVCCHLAADKKGKINLAKRVGDTRAVLDGIELEYDKFEADLQLSGGHVILMGDLNYRCTCPVPDALGAIAGGELARLCAADELSSVMRSGTALHGFREAPITFLPSFRRVAGEAGRLTNDEIATSAHGATDARLRELWTVAASDGTERVPSYTDRILLHSLPDLRAQFTCERYGSVETLCLSDHRPVFADLALSAPVASEVCADLTCELTVRALRVEPVAASGGEGGAPPLAPSAVALVLPLPAEKTGGASLERIGSLFGRAGNDAASRDDKVAWAKACADGVTARSRIEGGAERRIHAMLALSNTSGASVGQAVLALLPPSRSDRAPPSASERAVITSAPEPQPFEVELSVQSQLVGKLVGEAAVRWTP